MKPAGRPLILTAETERLPGWVRARDTALTLLLWIGCGWMWLQLFPEVERWLEARSRADLDYQLPAVVPLLRQGLLLTGVLLVSYLIWSYRTWRGANRDTALPPPPHLPPDEEARAHGLPPDQLPSLRSQTSLTVLMGRDGRVESWRPGSG